MKIEDAPMLVNALALKENLITTIQPKKKKNSKNINSTQFIIKEDESSIDGTKTFTIKFYCYRVMVIMFSIILFASSTIPSLVTGTKESSIINKIILFLVGLIAILLLLIFSNDKLVITKDAEKGKAIIKIINFLCFPNKTIVLDKENVIFNLINYSEKDSDANTLYIYNNYKKLEEIDLDKSDIKQKPAKFIYKFNSVTCLTYDYSRLSKDLNTSIGSLYSDDNNPFNFDISKYMKKPKNLPLKQKYIKFHENFFTYQFVDPNNYSFLDCCMTGICAVINIILFIGIIIGSTGPNIILLLVFIGSLIIFNIFYYFLYRCIKSIKENIYRIDCIYSKDFDRIFIGIVKYTTTSYINSFEYQMNEINSFNLQKVGDDSIYDLKVEFKNKEEQQICNIKGKTEGELEGLIYLLNEKLISNANDVHKKK